MSVHPWRLSLTLLLAGAVWFACTPKVHHNTWIFPSGYVGEWTVVKDPSARPLPTVNGGLKLRFGRTGILRVDENDFADLSGLSQDAYLADDGKPIPMIMSPYDYRGRKAYFYPGGYEAQGNAPKPDLERYRGIVATE